MAAQYTTDETYWKDGFPSEGIKTSVNGDKVYKDGFPFEYLFPETPTPPAVGWIEQFFCIWFD